MLFGVDNISKSSVRSVIVIITIILGCLLSLPLQAVQAQDAPLAHMEIPSLNLQSEIIMAPVVYPTWDVSHLGERVGYLEMTAWFGQGGNTVLAGHSTTSDLRPSTWYSLDTLQAGSPINVVVGSVELQYAVAAIYRVADTDVSLVLPMDHERLTLITCAVDSWNGVTFTERIIVVALPTGRVALN